MATSKEYKDYIMEQLNSLGNVSCRQMMGEYLLYLNGVLFGGIYDDRLLVKITDTNKKYGMHEQLPYEGAKPMFMIDDVDSKEIVYEIIVETYKGLPAKNK